MAKPRRHEAQLVLKDRQGTVFEVRFGRSPAAATRKGYLEVRDGGLVWYPAAGQRGWTLTWPKVNEEARERWRGGYRTFDPRHALSRAR